MFYKEKCLKEREEKELHIQNQNTFAICNNHLKDIERIVLGQFLYTILNIKKKFKILEQKKDLEQKQL